MANTMSHASPVSEGSLKQMMLIREFERQIELMFARGQIRGTTHLAVGQEAVAVGAAHGLEPQDLVFSTYRGHHHNLARGMDLESAAAEILGREGGCVGGKGGSMHLADVELGLMGSYAIVGGHIPIAVGAAWAAQLKGEDVVTCCFFGDGTTTIGAFHEAVNLASVWDLPIVFVCENNLYSEYTPIGAVSPVEHPAADRARAYGLEPIIVDGNDVEEVALTVRRARQHATDGGGPTMIEALTYRQSGHSRSDPGNYRPEGELEHWISRDPIARLRGQLDLSDAAFDDLEQQVRDTVVGAVERAQSSPEPDQSALHDHVYGEVRQ